MKINLHRSPIYHTHKKSFIANPLVHYNYLKITFAIWKTYANKKLKQLEFIELHKNNLNEYFESSDYNSN